jgi:hypothetical protein
VELKITVDPWQNGFSEAVMVIEGVRTEFTTMVIGLEVIWFPLTHIKLEVSVHVKTSPFEGVYIIIGPVPAGLPFRFH